MRSPKSMHWWAWKKKQENRKHNTYEKKISENNFIRKVDDIKSQIGGATGCKIPFLKRVRYLPTIPMDDYSKVRSRMDDIYMLTSGDKPTIESMERKE